MSLCKISLFAKIPVSTECLISWWHLAQPCSALAGLQELCWQEGSQGLKFHCLWSAKGEADLPKAEWGADTLTIPCAREGSGGFATCFDGRRGIFSSHLRRPQIVEQQEGMLAAKWSWVQSCKMISKLSLSTAFCRGQEHGFGTRGTQTDFCLAQQQREICQGTSAEKLETGPTA